MGRSWDGRERETSHEDKMGAASQHRIPFSIIVGEGSFLAPAGLGVAGPCRMEGWAGAGDQALEDWD